MACDTFLKIVQKCKRKFVIVQVSLILCHPSSTCSKEDYLIYAFFYLFIVICFASNFQVGESEPFVSELLTSLPTTVADLEPHQIHTFYESVCVYRIFLLKIWFN